MQIFLILARACVAYVAAAAFIVGQFFFGNFEIHSSIAGVTGILTLVLNATWARKSVQMAQIAAVCGVISIAAVVFDIFDYYQTASSNSGSYYPWFLMVPYIAAIALLIRDSLKNRPN